MDEDKALTPFDSAAVESVILEVRGKRVMLDMDLARFDGVSTKQLNRAVARNPGRFPSHFMFQITREEDENLRFQSGTSRSGHGGRRYLPHAFTEHGALQVSAVLNSVRAEQVGDFIVEAIVRLRAVVIRDLDFAKRLIEIERKLGAHDRVLKQLTDAARHFIQEQAKLKAQLSKRVEPTKKRRPGFRHED
jgi:hypothetical protein